MEYYLCWTPNGSEHNVLNKLPTNIVQMEHSLSTLTTTNKNDVQYTEELFSKQFPGITFTADTERHLELFMWCWRFTQKQQHSRRNSSQL